MIFWTRLEALQALSHATAMSSAFAGGVTKIVATSNPVRAFAIFPGILVDLILEHGG